MVGRTLSYCVWPGHEATNKLVLPLLSPNSNVPHREHLTPLQATDPGGTTTMVTTSGRSFTRQIKTEETAVQGTTPATPGQLVLGN